MSSIGMKRGRNRGTVNTSQGGPTTNKNGKKNSGRAAKISKYFTVATKEDDLENSDELLDSPYKNCLSEVKSAQNNSVTDIDDFKTPKAINKVSKISSKPVEKNVKKKKTRQLPLRKFVEDNLKHSDVNPEHLQMALALSESSYQAENPNTTPSSQEKRDSFKLAFEKFGFGYSKSKVSAENRREPCDSKKLHKKSRYRFITPVLKIRTDEERETLIASKVSLILAQNNRKSVGINVQQPDELFCENLQKCRRRRLFALNCTDISQLKSVDAFYIQGLGVESSHAPCGCLLKDWRSIPGREHSPEPTLTQPTLPSPPACADVASPSFENSRCSTKRRISGSNLALNCSEIHMFDTSNIAGRDRSPELNLTPPTLNSFSTRLESTKISSPTLENLPVSSTKRQVSGSVIELSSDEDSLLDNRCNGNCVQERVNTEINSAAMRRLSLTFEDANRKSTDDRDLIEGDNFSSQAMVISKRTKHKKVSKYRLSPEVTSHMGRISPDGDTPRSAILDSTLNFECGDFITSCDTAKSGNDSLLSPTSQEHTSVILELSKRSPSLAIKSPFVDTFTVKSPRSDVSITPSQRNKRPHDCLSPDLFDSDDEQPPSRLRGGLGIDLEETECYDLTQSDAEEDMSFHLKLSDAEEISRRSDLNITDYVQGLLSNYKEAPSIKKREKISTSEDEAQQSQSSVYVSDDELNYSSVFSTPHPRTKVEYDLSEDEELGVSLTERIKSKYKEDLTLRKEQVPESYATNSYTQETVEFPLPEVAINHNHPSRLPLTNICADNFSHTPNIPPHVVTTPTLEDSLNEALTHIPPDTPSTSNGSFVIKTKNVTPMANYDQMDTPKIVKALDKYGLKPLKRQKGAKLLKYIYEATHPTVGDENQVMKKRRTHYPHFGGIIGDVGEEGEVILERKQSKKIAGCAVPLHVVWHNFVMSNPKIRENILLYEPLQLEVLHSMLKDLGFKFNVQDLLAFLDKKCITIRTAQGQHHGKNPR